MTKQEILEKIKPTITKIAGQDVWNATVVDADTLSSILHSLSERIEALEGKNSVNFMQAGRTFECGHCHPEKYQLINPINCDCKCHDHYIGAGGGKMVDKTFREDKWSKEMRENAAAVDKVMMAPRIKDPTPPEDWEKEFDNMFWKLRIPNRTRQSKDVKDFIKSTIEKEREKIRRELVAMAFGFDITASEINNYFNNK